jgi:hypothetical protein
VGFHTKQCPDNTLTDSEGYQVWGPDEESAPEWTCPDRPDEFRLVTLISRHAIGLRTTIVGDLNCNDIPYEIGDAVVFINYLVFGESELCGGECASIPDCETYQTDASDINGDGYFWTVADLVMLLNIINGYDYPASKASL